jgi:hypothetical protein
VFRLALAPFVIKIKFYPPSASNQSKNASHIDYIVRPGAVDYGDLEPESSATTAETVTREYIEDASVHAKYMAERPRSEGLFSSDGPLDVAATKNVLANHQGIVWRAIVSLREDEASRINHLDYADWQETLQQAMPRVAQEIGIPESNFRWAAAYHPEPGHPHCHILFWEHNPERTRGALSVGEMRGVKKAFVRYVYARERERLGIEKTFYREEIRKGVRDALGLKRELDRESEAVRAEIGDPPGLPPRMTFQQREQLGQKLLVLGTNMPGRGRIALGYLPEHVKQEVRELADWLLRQPQFSTEVEKYLNAHTEYTKIYTHHPGQIQTARQKAYNDLRDRICNDLLRGAVNLAHNSENSESRHTFQYSLANTIWKAVWQSVQRERSRAEYQARRLYDREREERRRKEGRDR